MIHIHSKGFIDSFIRNIFYSIKDPRVVGGWIGKIISNKVALAILCDAYQKGCV
jgi:hypothetical protein